MMTKEEVAQIITYCDENKISYKQRLSELGISAGSFYDAKRKYAPKQGDDTAGEFLQLVSGGSFLPNPIKPARSRSGNLSGRELTDMRKSFHTLSGVVRNKIGGDPMNGDV